MARPRTEIGTFGTIQISEVRPGLFEARARFRLRNGRMARPRRRAKSGTAAERKLKKAMSEMADQVAGKKINRDTRFGRVIDVWLTEFQEKVDRGERATKSLYDYQDSADQLRKHMGELTCAEAENSGLCDETLKAIRRDAGKSNRSKGGSGYAAAKRARTVLTGVCAVAVRHQAMRVNPAKGVEEIEKSATGPVRALEPDERTDFRTKLRTYCEKKAVAKGVGVRGQAWTDLPDIVDGCLATGSRPGELLATPGTNVAPGARTVLLDHHLVRIEGKGMERVYGRKGGEPPVKPMYPTWAAPMFTRRKLAAGDGPLFPTWNGQWLDPSNVAKRLREACDEIGYGWVSARMFRHTVGTHITDTGLSNEHASDQLGNTSEVVERHYRRKKVTNPAAAAALETMFDGKDTGS